MVPAPDARPAAALRARWSVRAHLALVAVLAALAIGAVTLSSYVWGVRNEKSDARADLADRSQQVAKALAADLASGMGTAAALAAQPTIASAFTSSEPCSLTSDGTVNFPVVRIDIVRADGAIGCSSVVELVGLSRRPHAASSWLAESLRRPTATFLDAVDAPSRGRALVVTARFGPPTRPLGVIAFVAPLAGVGDRLATTYEGLQHDSFTLVDTASASVLSSSEQRRGSPHNGSGEAKGLDGVKRIYAAAPVPGTSWRVETGRRTSLVVADARSVLLRQSAVGLVVLIALLVTVLVLDRRIVRPLRRLHRAVEEARRSPDPERVTASGAARELADIADEFNALQDVRAAGDAQRDHMLSHDALTGLPNRVGLRGVIEEHLAHDGSAAVISMGIDRFRILNESLGHDVADEVLVVVAGRLSHGLAPQDVLARFRGDEFVAFCPGVSSVTAAVEVARLMEGVLRDPIKGDTYDVAVTGTAGVAVTGDAPLSAAQLLRQADLAMHHAKRTGLEVAAYEPEHGSRAREHLDIERELRLAMERGELLMHYQPMVDITSGRVIGSEALVRWAHPTRGLLPPGSFLPVAERTGQVVEIGAIALHLACRQIARWDDRQLRIPVSVNVAVEQLRGGDLPSLVSSELKENGIDPTLLCLELTESSFLQDVTTDLDQLTQLRLLGVHLAIDDFGTGYSSLAYVQNLPVDKLKIDISFVRRIARDMRARHLVTAILGMARALSLDVVAEGVETREQLRALEEMGCRQAQGFLFGRPMTPGDLVEQLQASVLVPAARQPA